MLHTQRIPPTIQQIGRLSARILLLILLYGCARTATSTALAVSGAEAAEAAGTAATGWSLLLVVVVLYLQMQMERVPHTIAAYAATRVKGLESEQNIAPSSTPDDAPTTGEREVLREQGFDTRATEAPPAP